MLKTVKVSAHAPTVNITAPAAKEAVPGAYTVRWNGADADGDALVYRVEYSHDGTNWLVLATDLTATSWADDFSEFPGGPGAQLRVTATDGVNTTSTTSAAFAVPAKAPFVEIEEPASGVITALQGTEISLAGSAYDLQDEEITSDDQLIWISNMQGELGRGSYLSLDTLRVGIHTVYLKVTNSAGLSSKASVEVQIQPKGRRTTLADVYAAFNLYLGRNPVFGIETVGRVGGNFTLFIEDVRTSPEAAAVRAAQLPLENKDPYTGEFRVTVLRAH